MLFRPLSRNSTREHRLLSFAAGGPEGKTAELPKAATTFSEAMQPSADQKTTPPAVDQHREDPKDHVRSEEEQREQTLPKIAERMEGREEQQAKEFIAGAREILETDEEKKVFDTALNALTPQEQIINYRVMSASCQSIMQNTNISLPKSSVDRVGQRVFLGRVMFSSMPLNLKLDHIPESLRRTLDAANADLKLLTSAEDRQTYEATRLKMAAATKAYLDQPENAQLKQTLVSKHEAGEKELQEFVDDKKSLAKGGKFNQFIKSAEQMGQDISKELLRLIERLDGTHDMRYKLVTDPLVPDTFLLKLQPKKPEKYALVLEHAKKNVMASSQVLEKTISGEKEIQIQGLDALQVKVIVAELNELKPKKAERNL